MVGLVEAGVGKKGEGGRRSINLQEGCIKPEHDGFDPFPAIPTGQPQPEAASVASHQRLSELVSVIRRPVTRVNQDLRKGLPGSVNLSACDGH